MKWRVTTGYITLNYLSSNMIREQLGFIRPNVGILKVLLYTTDKKVELFRAGVTHKCRDVKKVRTLLKGFQ